MWIVAPLALAVVGVLAYGLFQGADALLIAKNKTGKPVDVNDVIKTAVTVITLIGAVLAGVYAYRKQRLTEGDSRRADASQLADRYSTAAEQLGHEQAAVRLAGVYAMARLADDWPEQRQVCIDVLCAYLRMPYETNRDANGFKTGEREVRHTIIRVIRDHLRDPEAPTTWCGLNLDFTGATFDGGDFSGAKFRGSEVTFFGAKFTSGRVAFFGAQFAGGEVDFGYAQFRGGGIDFRAAQFTGCRVSFFGAKFRGSEVTFNTAQFTGGEVDFRAAEFRGGEVHFGYAGFTGGEVTFNAARFTGGTVSFSGAVGFGGAEFTGGEVTFNTAQFTGGTVTFNGAEFTGGTVTFNGVRVASASSIDWGPFPVIPPNVP
ncbi:MULTISPECIES: pentapeptide repeat-containing protein [Streptomyces]|uniref:Pentapeptide repeat-containing protein n=1 Tax=Streptomyces ramulosus TaxID=47762 RepID=A0ABW1FJQ6_9ACTN